MGNDGNGPLTVKFDTTEPGLAPNQADVTYTFSSGTQPFFVNGGQMTVTGDWSSGWDGVLASPPSHIHVGPFGNGSGITFRVDGDITVQDAQGRPRSLGGGRHFQPDRPYIHDRSRGLVRSI